jgi:hypothetical protein
MTTNYSYPILLVRQIHALPHLNEVLLKQSSTFDVTYDSQSNSYTKSLLVLPIILGNLFV